jgi:hypothetical protein
VLSASAPVARRRGPAQPPAATRTRDLGGASLSDIFPSSRRASTSSSARRTTTRATTSASPTRRWASSTRRSPSSSSPPRTRRAARVLQHAGHLLPSRRLPKLAVKWFEKGLPAHTARRRVPGAALRPREARYEAGGRAARRSACRGAATARTPRSRRRVARERIEGSAQKLRQPRLTGSRASASVARPPLRPELRSLVGLGARHDRALVARAAGVTSLPSMCAVAGMGAAAVASPAQHRVLSGFHGRARWRARPTPPPHLTPPPGVFLLLWVSGTLSMGLCTRCMRRARPALTGARRGEAPMRGESRAQAAVAALVRRDPWRPARACRARASCSPAAPTRRPSPRRSGARLPIAFSRRLASTSPWSERRGCWARRAQPEGARALAQRLVGSLYWHDLAEVAARARVPAAVRARAEGLLKDGLGDMRLGDPRGRSRGWRRWRCCRCCWPTPRSRWWTAALSTRACARRTVTPALRRDDARVTLVEPRRRRRAGRRATRLKLAIAAAAPHPAAARARAHQLARAARPSRLALNVRCAFDPGRCTEGDRAGIGDFVSARPISSRPQRDGLDTAESRP